MMNDTDNHDDSDNVNNNDETNETMTDVYNAEAHSNKASEDTQVQVTHGEQASTEREHIHDEQEQDELPSIGRDQPLSPALLQTNNIRILQHRDVLCKSVIEY